MELQAEITTSAANQLVVGDADPRRLAITQLLAGIREGEAAGLSPRMFRRVQHYINTHLDSALRNEELAASVGLSVSHFCRSFARSVGTTPHNYVIRLRLLRAQQLLAETDVALTEIAMTTGFADQSHFSRRFRQFVGVPPKAFRRRYR